MSLLPDRSRALERKLHIQSKRVLQRYIAPPEAQSASAKHEKSLRDAIGRNRRASFAGELVRTGSE